MIEILAGAENQTEHDQFRLMLKDLVVLALNDSIINLIAEIIRRHGLKLPDASIAATALSLNMPFLSSDVGFKKVPVLRLIVPDRN